MADSISTKISSQLHLYTLSTGTRYYAFVAALLGVVGLGVYAYLTQLTQGLVVTGLRSQVMWGVYITNFVFFIGISHSGTFISAVLRVTNTEWRKPITRIGESITVFGLMFGGLSILFDLGRPDRFLHLIMYGRLDSPLIWDFVGITTYLAGSAICLYLPLIPDVAELRDNLSDAGGIKKWLYTKLSLGWTGTDPQKERLRKSIRIMAIIIIPIMISVHTVVSWVFAMTLRSGWHSTIFGPYFVAGAIYSGVASIIIAMAVFRRVYNLERFISIKHFKYLGYLLVVLSLTYIYFTINEFLTPWYGGNPEHVALLESLFTGSYALEFWSVIVFGLIAPIVVVAVPRTRNIWGITIAAVLANVAMWYKRLIIVVPALALPAGPGAEWASYSPTWVEISISLASVAGFVLLLSVFSKLFPIVSKWELQEGADEGSSPKRITPGGTVAVSFDESLTGHQAAEQLGDMR